MTNQHSDEVMSKRILEALKMWRILSANDFRRYVNEEVHLTLAERKALKVAIQNDDSDEARRFREESLS